jgi:Spore germination protein
MRRLTIPAIILFLMIVGIGGFLLGRTGIVNMTRQNNRFTNEAARPKISIVNKSDVVVFFVKPARTNFYLKPVLYRVNNDRDLHVRALEALFAGPSEQSKLLPVFPKETKVLGLTIKDGIAYVNLNQSAAKLNVGSSTENLAVASIVNTLTKFPDVFRVKILIEGKDAESLAGHVDITGLLQYDDQVVDPELFK